MAEHIAEKIKTADWKSEKHVPVIECKEKIQKDELIHVKLTVGKEVSHPNTTEHHIRWIRAYFVPDGSTSAYVLGSSSSTPTVKVAPVRIKGLFTLITR